MKLSVYSLLVLLSVFSNSSFRAQWVENGNVITFEPADSILNSFVLIDTVHYKHNQWQIGKPHKTIFDSAYSRPNAIVTDTVYPYCPNDTSVFTIHFPNRIINSMGYPDIPMQFSFYNIIDTDNATRIFIDFSKDTGQTWLPVVWTTYSSSGIFLPATGYLLSYLLYDSFYVDDQLRFTFIAGNDTAGKEGWMIDDIDIFYMWPEGLTRILNNPQFTLFPNPAKSHINIDAPELIHNVVVTNTLGQILLSEEYHDLKIKVDVSMLPQGLYFVKINHESIQRFLKE